jgi:hypothetical protein
VRGLALLAVAVALGLVPTASAAVGPGPVTARLDAGPYRLHLRITPHRALRTGVVTVALFRGGRPVDGARVSITVTMLEMNMGSFALVLPQTRSGVYARAFPVVGMGGRWDLRLDVANASSVHVVDRIAP